MGVAQPWRHPTDWPRRLIALLALFLPALSGAGPIEVDRVLVPSARVSTYFPPGTELRGMSLDEFEALVRSARLGFERQGRRSGPRLLRADHVARWEADSLIGRSTLLIDVPEGDASTPLPLDPWSPAIDPTKSRPADVRGTGDGRTFLRLNGSGRTTLTLAWELRARSGSEGRAFALKLPRLDAASLTLDLPTALIPEGPGGVRQGPAPGSEIDRRSWRFNGPLGDSIDLKLRAQGGQGGPAPAARVWVGGPTRIDVEEVSAHCRIDWTVDPGDGGPRWFAALLDPGLEPTEVTGPGVVGFQAEPAESGTRVTVRLAGEVAGPTPVTIHALATVPTEGPWAIPAAHPLDTHWTGGRTIVGIGPSRTLVDCREKAGRRVAPRPEDAVGEEHRVPPRPEDAMGEVRTVVQLVFEAFTPRSVAELTFGKPEADVSAEVRGQLRLGGEAPRLEAQVTWRVHHGRLLTVAVDLAPGWTPDRVQFAGRNEPTPWQADGSRLRVHPPPTIDPGEPLTLNIAAIGARESGPLKLPRVRPVDVRVDDELWVAQLGHGLSIRPIRAKGLAWVDPAMLAAPGATNPGGLRDALAWRWTAPDGEAEVEYARQAAETTSTIQETVTVSPNRLRLDWRVAIAISEADHGALPIHLSEPTTSAPDWRLLGDERGPPIPSHPIPVERRASFGLPRTGSAWELEIPRPRQGRVVVLARLEHPWTGRGSIPLLTLPDRFHPVGNVLVQVDRTMRSEAIGSGLRVLDPAQAWSAVAEGMRSALDEVFGAKSAPYRRAHAFGLRAPVGRLDLRTEALAPAKAEGLIREAILSTIASPGPGLVRQRLTLQVEPGKAGSLDVALPSGSTLERVSRDGELLVPSLAGRSLRLVLPSLPASRPTCSVVLEYQALDGPPGVPNHLEARAPEFSLPCLALGWEITLPGTWTVGDANVGLVAADPVPVLPWPQRLLGHWPSPWKEGKPSDPAEASMWTDLDDRVLANRGETLTLGDLLTRWDSGFWPLAIDRWALAKAGWGPRSGVVPARLAASRAGRPAVLALEPMGLTLVPIKGVFLVTTKVEAPSRLDRAEELEAWGRTLGEAIAWGSDPSDRFQAVTRWRGENTPRWPAADDVSPSPASAGDGESVRRFEATGWPASMIALHLEEEPTQVARGWAVGLAVLAVGIAGAKLSARWRAFGLAIALAPALMAASWVEPRGSTMVVGAACGTLGTLAYWLGRALRPPGPGPDRNRGSTTSLRGRRAGPEVAVGVALALAVSSAALAARIAADPPAPDRPILALIPYEGVPDPTNPGKNVIIPLADHDRLRAWADAGEEPMHTGLSSPDVVHRVRLEGDRDVVVESRFDLVADGPGPADWIVPIGDARDATATLDDKDVPVFIKPGGPDAAISVGGIGRHHLIVRRIVPLERDEAGETASLPINPVATSRVVVERPATGRQIELSTARGHVAATPDGVEGLLGPTDRLRVRWLADSKTDRTESLGTVDGLVLWDAEPAGDRVRARLKFHHPEGTALIRLGLEPGLVVRSASVPGLLDASWRGTAEHPEWVGRVAPPLADGESLQIDLWRPREMTRGEPDPTRTLPRLEPLGVEHPSLLVGFRRPLDWSGTLVPGPGGEAVQDDAFVLAWGTLPPGPVTLAGASRFARTPRVEVSTAPIVPRISVLPTVHLEIAPGRLTWRVDAVLADRAGRSFATSLRVPGGLRVVRVEGDGLTSWNRPEPERLQLRFDGPEAARRSIQIEGWIPVESDPLAIGVLRHEVGSFWPTWPGADVEPGTLTVSGSGSAQIDEKPGVVPIAPVGDPTTRPPLQSAYRIERGEGPGPLRWVADPPRVDVAVRSQLTIHPETAEWVALVQYQVWGGAVDAIRLKLPTAWADPERVQVEGGGGPPSAKVQGGTTEWTFRPDRPIWGGRRVVIRSERPLPKGSEPLTFPDIVPLGWGTVDTYLALANASGRKLVAEGSPGLEQVDASRFSLDDLPESKGVTRDVYRVRRDGWTLRLQAGPDALGTRVASADLTCVLAADGSALGLARFEIEARPGPFLPVLLTEDAEALGAAVDGVLARPLRGRSGRWWVPLGDGRARRVVLLWRGRRAGPDRDGGRAVPLPSLDQASTSTLVTVYAPEDLAVEASSGPLAPIRGDVIQADRTEWLGRRIAESLDEIDRSSPSAREALIADLIRFELQARDARRSARWMPNDRSPAAHEAMQRVIRRAETARTGLLDVLGAAGLDEQAQTAQARVGLPARGPAGWTDIPAEPLRLRLVGRPHNFRGEMPGHGQAAPIRWSTIPPARPWLRAEFWGMIPLAVGIALIFYAVARRGERSIRLAIVALASMAALPALGVEPLALVAALGLVVVGRFSGGRAASPGRA